MSTYARIESGAVAEIIAPVTDELGSEIDVADRFTPDIVAQLVDITDLPLQPSQGFAYVNGVFMPPVVHTEGAADIHARALANVRQIRTPMLAVLSGIAGMADRAGDSATAQAADATSQALIEMTLLPAFVAAATYDEKQAIILARYAEIVAATPANIQAVVREVLGI